MSPEAPAEPPPPSVPMAGTSRLFAHHRVWLLLLVVLLGGLAVRIAHYRAVSRSALPEFPKVAEGIDSFFYWEWTTKILRTGDWLGRDPYHYDTEPGRQITPERRDELYRQWGGRMTLHWEPMYPWFVAAVRLSGADVRGVLLAQLLLGSLQALVVFALARALIDDRGALIAAAIAAFYGPLVFVQGTLMRDWLQPLLEPLILIGLLHARKRGGWWRWLLAGLPMGLCLWSKSTVMLFIPVAAGWIIWEQRGSWRAAAACVMVWLAGVATGFSPLVMRNAVVGAPLLRIQSRVPEGLIWGNAADADPIGLCQCPSFEAIMNKSAGSAWVAAVETLKTYHGDWRAIAAREWRKFRGLVDPFEVPNNLSYRYAAEVSPVLRGLLTYGILLPVALAGMVLVGLADWRRHLLPLLFLGAATGWLMLSMMVGRFRLTLMPGLAVYAAAGLVFAWDALRAGRWWRAGLWAALLAAAALLQHAVMPLPDVRRNPHQMTYWMEYVSANRFYISQGDYGRAIDEARRLQAAAEGRPGLEGAFYKGCAMELRTRLELARRLLAAGRAQEARSQVRQAHEAGRLIPAYTTIDREFERQFTACGDTEAAEACRQRLKAEEGAAAPPHDDKTP